MLNRSLRMLALGLLATLACGARADGPPDAKQGVAAYLQQMIPLRDGVHLSAAIWRPLDQVKPLPVVMVLTPYVSDETHNRAVKFVKAGYVYVSVDVRGRGESEGVYTPLRGNGPDGADAIEWLAQQPWCDGRVVMMGGSYRGMVQWQILAQHPKHLVAVVPTASVYPGHDFPNAKGVMPSYTAQWLAFTSGRTSHEQLFGDGDYWLTQFTRMYMAGAAFTTLAPLAGDNQHVFEEWLQHHAYDAYWASYNPDPKAWSTVDIPILAITGWFDGDQPGEMRYYREFSANAKPAELARLTLLAGPWDHAGTRYPQKTLGGVTFPDNSVLDIDQLQIDWFNWVLKGGKRPEILSDRVNFYEMGEGQWHHASSLAGMNDHTAKFYLSSVDGDASDVFHSGRLTAELPKDTEGDSLVLDPAGRDGLSTGSSPDFMLDQTDAFQKGHLIYQTGPLQQPMTIAGYVKLTLNLSVDTPDADVAAALYAITPDGKALALGSDYVRGRFRRGMEQEVPVTPGAVEPWVFDGFYLTDQQIPAGSRLRLVLLPLDTPFLERNANTGGPLGGETAHGRVAHVSVHLDAAHPSFLELPVAKP